MAWYSIAQYILCVDLWWAMLYSTVLCCTRLQHTRLDYIVLYCIVSYHIVLYYTHPFPAFTEYTLACCMPHAVCGTVQVHTGVVEHKVSISRNIRRKHLYYIVVCYIILHYVTYTLVFFIILSYNVTVLYYVVPYYTTTYNTSG